MKRYTILGGITPCGTMEIAVSKKHITSIFRIEEHGIKREDLKLRGSPSKWRNLRAGK
jgi:hypothetical protein